MPNLKMNALQMVQEVALRLGITRPVDIEVIAGSQKSIIDRDAEILLGALNQSVRSAAAAFTWREMVLAASERFYDSSGSPVSPIYSVPVLHLTQNLYGYDGLTTSYISIINYDTNRKEWPVYPRIVRQVTLDKYLMLQKTDKQYDDIYDSDRTENGFIIINGTLFLARPFIYEDPNGYKDPRAVFTYKTNLPVVADISASLIDSGRKPLFTKNTDGAAIDDEAVILGAIMNYKNYIGRDFQLEAKLFTDYIEHMKERNGGLTIIEESEYSMIADRMHRYPPHSSGAQKKPQAPQPQQGQQPRGPQQE
jgi:hypothetical protein